MDRKAKLEELKLKRIQSQKLNHDVVTRTVLIKSHKSQKKVQAEELQQRREIGEDIERLENLGKYDVRDTEDWLLKTEEKKLRANKGMTDFAQIAQKAYTSVIGNFKPDLYTYRKMKKSNPEFYRNADSLQYGMDETTPEGMNRLVTEMEKREKKRGLFSKRRKINDEEDVTYINERNMRFNQKVDRAYDKFTKEIKGNFERGTAL